MFKISPGVKSIFVNSAYVYLASLLNTLLRLGYVFFIAKILGAELYGLLAYGQSWYLAILPFAGLGLGSILAIEVGRKGPDSLKISELVFGARIMAIIALTLVSFALVFINEGDSTTLSLLLIFSCAILGKGLTNWSINMFQAHEQSKHVFNVEKSFRPPELLLGLLIAFYTEDIIYIAINHTFFMLSQGLYNYFKVRAIIGNIKPNFSILKIKAIVISVLPLAIATPLSQFLLQGPILLFKSMGGSLNMVGNLALALQGFVVLNLLFTSASTAAVPVLSRASGGDNDNLTLFARYAIKIAIVVGFIVALVAGTVVKPVIFWIFPVGFEYTANHMGLLLLTLIPSICKNLLRSILVTEKKFIAILVSDVAGVFVLCFGAYVLIESYQFTGIILSIMAAYTIAASIILLSTLPIIKLEIGNDIIKPLAVMVIHYSLYLLLTLSLADYLAVFIAVASFSASIFLTNIITKQEQRILYNLIKSKM